MGKTNLAKAGTSRSKSPPRCKTSTYTMTESVAVIGAGVSGIAAANVWQKCGYKVTVFEASGSVGGQWTDAYEDVRLQNTAHQYEFADFPWPEEPDHHPTGAQVLSYLQKAAQEFNLNIRLNCPVQEMEEIEGGWEIKAGKSKDHPEVVQSFCYVVIATGQYPWGGKAKPFPGSENFRGIVTNKITSLDEFNGKRVAVIGFGKTALDFATWSVGRSQSTTHIFRNARWTMPEYVMGVEFTYPFFARATTSMLPSWCHSWSFIRAIHENMKFGVSLFWNFVASITRRQYGCDARIRSEEDKERLKVVMPPNDQFLKDLRGSAAITPTDYYKFVAHGKIRALNKETKAFTANSVKVADKDGKNEMYIAADMVCVCCGNSPPNYPYMPQKYRDILEKEMKNGVLVDKEGGPALYRHLIEPKIQNVGFAGYNHGLLHLPLVEVGALWMVAVHSGDLRTPFSEQMQASARRVEKWKERNCAPESTRNLAVGARFQQSVDILMQDLGMSQWRMMPNIFAEVFGRYGPAQYKGVIDKYIEMSERRRERGEHLEVVPQDA